MCVVVWQPTTWIAVIRLIAMRFVQAPAGEQLAHPGGIHYMANPHPSYCPVHARKGRQLS